MAKPKHFAHRPGVSTTLRFDFGALDVPGQRELERFSRTGRRRLLGLGGVRGGKSWYGSRWGLRQAFTRGGLGWILVPEFSYASEVVRLINEVLYEHWEVVADHHEHPYPMWRLRADRGAQIEIRSSYDPDVIRASTLTWGWMDEAARQSVYAYRNLEQRLLASRGPILLTTTPTGKNWVHQEVYVPFTQDHPDYGVAILRTADNPHLPADEVKQLRERWSDGQFAAQELDAEFVSFEGLCYQLDAEADIIERDQVPLRDKFHPIVAGIDWGYSDPVAVVVIGRAEGVWYVIDEFYGQRISLDELANILVSFRQMYQFSRVWIGQDRPEIARFLRDRGLHAQTVWKSEIGEGVALIAGLIREDKLKVVRSCVNTINEFGLYQYQTTRAGEKKSGEKPLDKFNHAMDALRYALTSEFPLSHPPIDVRSIEVPVWR